MLSIETQELFVSLLRVYIEGERQVEVVRQVLAELPAFDPYSAFHHIDQTNQGYLAQVDIARFMRECQRPISDYDAGLVTTSWSGLGSRLVAYEDFLNAVLPATSDRLRSQATNRSEKQPLTFEAIYALCRVIERELDFQVKLEASKADLQSKRDFSITGLFTVLDNDQDQYVSEGDLLLFCRRLGVYLYPDDIKSVFRRVDKDRDGLLNLREIRGMLDARGNGVTPKQRNSPVRSSPHRSTSPLKPSRTLESTSLDSGAHHRSLITKASNRSPMSPEKTSQVRVSEASTVSRRLNYGGEEGLKEVLEGFCRVLGEVERAKVEMAEKEDFSMKGVYEVFRCEDGDDITVVQLTKTMEYLGLRPDHQEIQTLFRRYDKDHDHLLQPKEFIAMICPYNASAREAILRRKSISKAKLSEESIEMLRKVLKMLLDSEVELNRTRQRLYIRRLVDLHKTFLEGDSDNDTYLSSDEVKKLVGRDAGLLMSRFDHDHDGKMSFTDFLHEIIPS